MSPTLTEKSSPGVPVSGCDSSNVVHSPSLPTAPDPSTEVSSLPQPDWRYVDARRRAGAEYGDGVGGPRDRVVHRHCRLLAGLGHRQHRRDVRQKRVGVRGKEVIRSQHLRRQDRRAGPLDERRRQPLSRPTRAPKFACQRQRHPLRLRQQCRRCARGRRRRHRVRRGGDALHRRALGPEVFEPQRRGAAGRGRRVGARERAPTIDRHLSRPSVSGRSLTLPTGATARPGSPQKRDRCL